MQNNNSKLNTILLIIIIILVGILIFVLLRPSTSLEKEIISEEKYEEIGKNIVPIVKEKNIIVEDNKKQLFKFCPNQKIVNNMSGMVNPGEVEPVKSYYIYNGERKEIADFDQAWVSENCSVPEQIVY